MIQFAVYGSPVAQPRQRHRIVRTNDGRQFTQNYTSSKDPVQSWKLFVREAAQQAGAVALMGPVQMNIDFYLPRPANLSRKKDPDGPIFHAAGKDVDNLYKSVADCLIGICYQDDRQVAWTVIRKFYHERNGAPRAEISIIELETGCDNDHLARTNMRKLLQDQDTFRRIGK